MDLNLKGKRALVAGASRGLGYAIAHLLAEEGCRVAINGRNTQTITAAAQKIATDTLNSRRRRANKGFSRLRFSLSDLQPGSWSCRVSTPIDMRQV